MMTLMLLLELTKKKEIEIIKNDCHLHTLIDND